MKRKTLKSVSKKTLRKRKRKRERESAKKTGSIIHPPETLKSNG